MVGKYFLAITPTPSIDRAMVIPGFQLGEIHRPQKVLSQAGGKGLNVARAIRRLGGSVKACLLLAGYNGRWIAEQLEKEGIGFTAAWADGETRISTSIIDPTRTGLTEIYERGEPINYQAWECFEENLQASLPDAVWATFSGSLPPGAPPDGLARLISIVKSEEKPYVVDVRGKFLSGALSERPMIVKINASEAAEVLSRPVVNVEQALEAADSLCRLGVGTSIITLGSQGAVAASQEGRWYGQSPAIQAIAPVGSGDSFLGALVMALSQDSKLPDALRQGIAAGAANAMTIGVAMIDPQTVAEIADQVVINPV